MLSVIQMEVKGEQYKYTRGAPVTNRHQKIKATKRKSHNKNAMLEQSMNSKQSVPLYKVINYLFLSNI